MSKKINKLVLLVSVVFLLSNISVLKTYGAISLECNSCKKQIEGYESNKKILEEKLNGETAKQNPNQSVIAAIELRINEFAEQISELQDVLDLCEGKKTIPDPSKCNRYKKQIEGYESNIKILEQKTKDNPNQYVMTAAEAQINELKNQMKSFQDILNICEEVQNSVSKK